MPRLFPYIVSPALTVCALALPACSSSDEPSDSTATGGASGSGGTGNTSNGGSGNSSNTGGSGTGGSGNSSSGGSTSAGGSGSSSSGGSTSAGGSGSSSSGGTGATAGSAGTSYVPPSTIVGGHCGEVAGAPSPPCSSGPVQEYCSVSDRSMIIMAVCSSSGRTQCEVIDDCEPGWHACTATEYVARGGREVAPSFSTTNHAWLAACVRDVTGSNLKNEPCSVCGQEVAREPSVQWWCDGEVVYEGGMAGDTLGVQTSPECMRVGENTPDHAAFWTMGFTSGGSSFVMCCLDGP